MNFDFEVLSMWGSAPDADMLDYTLLPTIGAEYKSLHIMIDTANYSNWYLLR